MDEGFIGRTYRTSAWVTLLVFFYMVSLGKTQAAWSTAAGALLGLGVLRALEWFVRRSLTPGAKRGPWLALQVVKLPLLASILYLVVHSGWFHLPAFAAGVMLIQAVIFLKAVGRYLDQRDDAPAGGQAKARAGDPTRG